MAAPVTYRFFTVWDLPGDVAEVWAALRQPVCYAGWWPGMTTSPVAEGTTDPAPEVSAGTDLGGGTTAVAVRGLLPGPIRYTLKLIKSDQPEQLTFEVRGGLTGTCRVALVGHEDGTDVLTFWDVRTATKWPGVLAAAFRWLFAWNHNRVMLAGERGLRAWLTARRRWADRPRPVVIATRMTVYGDFPGRSSEAPAEWRPRAA